MEKSLKTTQERIEIMTNAMKAFCDRKFGMFIHWGLYALPGGRHNGKVMEYIGEWFQSYFRMPNEEYAEIRREIQPR